MYFRSLTLQGFKKFRDSKIVFNRGLNVFLGPNEVGKTTIHQAILTSLYGLGAKVTGLLRDDVLNWNHMSTCRVGLEFEYENKLYRLERDFVKKKVSLSQFDKQKNAFEIINEDGPSIQLLLIDFLGIQSPEVFCATVSISQNELLAAADNLSSVGQNIEYIFSGCDSRSSEEIIKNLLTMRKKLRKKRNEKPGKLDILEEEIKSTKAVIERLQIQEEERKELEVLTEQQQRKVERSEKRLEQLVSLLEKYYTKHGFVKRHEELKKRCSLLQQRVQSLEQVEKELKILESQLVPFEPILTFRDRISDFRYSVQRLSEIDCILEEMMQRKIDSTSYSDITTLYKVKHIISLLLISLFVFDFGFMMYALFLNLHNVFTSTFVVLIVIVLCMMLLRFLPGFRGSISEFQKLTEERKLVLVKITEILTCWKFTEKTEPTEVMKTLEALEKLEDSIGKKEIQLRTLYDAGEREEIQKELENVRQEIVEVEKVLQQMSHYNPDFERVEQWEQEQKQLREVIPKQKQELYEQKGRLQELKKQKHELQDEISKLEYLEREFVHLEYEYRALEIALEHFQDVMSNYNAVYIPKLEELSTFYFSSLTKGRYQQIDLSKWPRITVSLLGTFERIEKIEQESDLVEQKSIYEELQGGEEEKMELKRLNPYSLSQGTVDQLYFSLRLAAGELLSKRASLPLLIDDAFMHFDEKRLIQALKLLLRFSSQHQILYFTHNDRVASLLDDLDVADHTVTLVSMEGL